MHNIYVEAPLAPLFLRTAIPVVAIMSVSGLHALVDAYFLGAYVGPQALSAVTIVFPAIMAMVALQALVSGGMASLVARRLGAADRIGAAAIYGSARWLALALAAGLWLLFLLAGRPLVTFAAGGPGAVADNALVFIGIMVAGAPVGFLLSLEVDLLRCEGRLRLMAGSTVAATGLNMLANWLLIAVAGMGTAGSATATVFAQALCLGVLLFDRARGGDRLAARHAWRRAAFGAILGIGAPLSLGLLGVSLSAATVLAAIKLFGEGRIETIAAYGVITRILTFAYLPLMGTSIAFQTICGQNFGAGRIDRVAASLAMALAAALFYCAALEAILLFGAPLIAGAFTDDQAVVAEVARILPSMVAAYLLFGPALVLSGYFQALGDARRAAVFGLTRAYLLAMPLTFLLPLFFGEPGIWRAPMAADLAMAVLALAIIGRDGRRHGWRYGLIRPQRAAATAPLPAA